MTGKGLYYTANYDLGLHFPEDTIRVEKYDSDRIYSVVYFDGEQNYYYVKRFNAESSDNKMQNFVEDTGGAGKTAPPKNYVAGDTVEFDIAAEEEQQQNTKQMNLFGEE